jgi:hypothetical protein
MPQGLTGGERDVVRESVQELRYVACVMLQELCGGKGFLGFVFVLFVYFVFFDGFICYQHIFICIMTCIMC